MSLSSYNVFISIPSGVSKYLDFKALSDAFTEAEIHYPLTRHRGE